MSELNDVSSVSSVESNDVNAPRPAEHRPPVFLFWGFRSRYDPRISRIIESIADSWSTWSVRIEQCDEDGERWVSATITLAPPDRYPPWVGPIHIHAPEGTVAGEHDSWGGNYGDYDDGEALMELIEDRSIDGWNADDSTSGPVHDEPSDEEPCLSPVEDPVSEEESGEDDASAGSGPDASSETTETPGDEPWETQGDDEESPTSVRDDCSEKTETPGDERQDEVGEDEASSEPVRDSSLEATETPGGDSGDEEAQDPSNPTDPLLPDATASSPTLARRSSYDSFTSTWTESDGGRDLSSNGEFPKYRGFVDRIISVMTKVLSLDEFEDFTIEMNTNTKIWMRRVEESLASGGTSTDIGSILDVGAIHEETPRRGDLFYRTAAELTSGMSLEELGAFVAEAHKHARRWRRGVRDFLNGDGTDE